jgi:hypothetical protein
MYFWLHFNKHIDNRFFEADTGANQSGGAAPAIDPAKAAPVIQPNAGPQGESKPVKTFTQEELDNIVKERVARATEKKAKEIEEAQKLANMSESERSAEELKKAQGTIAEYQRKELISQFKIELQGKGLPAEFADHINVFDAEKAKAAIDFITKYKNDTISALNDKIKQLETDLNNANLRGITPKAVNGAANSSGNLSPIGKLFTNQLNNK